MSVEQTVTDHRPHCGTVDCVECAVSERLAKRDRIARYKFMARRANDAIDVVNDFLPLTEGDETFEVDAIKRALLVARDRFAVEANAEAES